MDSALEISMRGYDRRPFGIFSLKLAKGRSRPFKGWRGRAHPGQCLKAVGLRQGGVWMMLSFLQLSS